MSGKYEVLSTPKRIAETETRRIDCNKARKTETQCRGCGGLLLLAFLGLLFLLVILSYCYLR